MILKPPPTKGVPPVIRLAIVEDDTLYITQLKEYLEQYQKESGNELELVIFRDGEDIAEDYHAEYDIILMDIQMRFMDGMTAAEKIRQMDQEVIIMFITNMTQYAIRGYAVDALDYILKPVTYFALSQKLNRAIERMHKRSQRFITIPVRDGVQKLEISAVYYIESQGHSLVYHTKNGEFLSSGKMKDMEDLLQEYGFFRSNKGYLVNMEHVDGVQDGCCMLRGEKLLISRSRKNQFMEALANHMSGVRK